MPASEVFFNQYLTTILWAENPGKESDDAEDDDRSFQDHGVDRTKFDPELAATLRETCDKFCDDPAVAADLALWRDHFGDDEEAGHDFWLSAQGHGMGFWSRFGGVGPKNLEEAGDRLTEASKHYERHDTFFLNPNTGLVEL